MTIDASASWRSKLDDDRIELGAQLGWHHASRKTGSIDPALDGTPAQTLGGLDLGVLSELGGETPAAARACKDGGPGDRYPMIVNCPVNNYAVGGPGEIGSEVQDRLGAHLAIAGRLASHRVEAGLDGDVRVRSALDAASGGFELLTDAGVVELDELVRIAPLGTANPAFDQVCPTVLNTGVVASLRCQLVDRSSTPVTTRALAGAAYLRDTWQLLPTLRFEAGLRYEAQRLFYPDDVRNTVDAVTGSRRGDIALAPGGGVAPRVGASYDPTDTGRAKLFTSWGRSFQPIPMHLERELAGDGSLTSSALIAGCARQLAPGIPDGLGCYTSGGIGITTTSVGSERIAPDLGAPYEDELIAGGELELVTGLVAGAAYQHRELGRAIEDVAPDGGTYIIANPGEWSASSDHALVQQIRDAGDLATAAKLQRELDLFRGIAKFDKPRRNYDALQLELAGHVGGLRVRASYVDSRTEGNYSGLVDYDDNAAVPNISPAFDLIELAPNRIGALPQDRPHYFKLDGYYALDLRRVGTLTVGVRFRALSETPVTAVASHELYGPESAMILPRGALGRTGPDHELDIHVGFYHHLTRRVALELFGDVFNVYDRQAAQTIDMTYVAYNGGVGIGQQNAAPVSGGSYADLVWLKAIDRIGNETAKPVVRDPNFLHATSRYAPLYAQVGFRLTF